MLWTVVLVSGFLSVVWCQRIPENPCPEIFRYGQENGIYYGTINIPYDGSKSLDLAVNISMVGLYDNVKVNLDLLTPADQILSAQTLTYRVNFPFQNVIPKITQIAFNGRIYCSGPSEPVSTSGVTNLWANILFRINQYNYNIPSGINTAPPHPTPPNPVNNIQSFSPQTIPPSIQPSTNLEDICGISNNVQQLVLHGTKTANNEFPWLVAMFHRQGVSYEFQCTGNLITNKHVVTAAHCVWFFKAPLIDKEDILLVLGHSDLTHWATVGTIRSAQEVTPHPNYKQGSGHCDIAVITMNEPVAFKPTIRPICLWQGDTSLEKIVNSKGTVAGWGKTEEARKVVAVPRKVTMPIVSQYMCLKSNTEFTKLTSEETFCAGNRDGSGPCSGDSGAGYIMKRGERWYLRGLVSTALKTEDYSCNLSEYIVFTDVAQLGDWLKSVVK